MLYCCLPAFNTYRAAIVKSVQKYLSYAAANAFVTSIMKPVKAFAMKVCGINNP